MEQSKSQAFLSDKAILSVLKDEPFLNVLMCWFVVQAVCFMVLGWIYTSLIKTSHADRIDLCLLLLLFKFVILVALLVNNKIAMKRFKKLIVEAENS